MPNTTTLANVRKHGWSRRIIMSGFVGSALLGLGLATLGTANAAVQTRDAIIVTYVNVPAGVGSVSLRNNTTGENVCDTLVNGVIDNGNGERGFSVIGELNSDDSLTAVEFGDQKCQASIGAGVINATVSLNTDDGGTFRLSLK